MDTKTATESLTQIPANRRLVEELYSHGYINTDGKSYALNLLYPHDQWGLWVSRLLLVFGSALVLSGIIYFFAFNWTKLTPAVKLVSIQVGLVGCLVGAYYCSLSKLSGQVFLLAATVLVGVFMAVFGQIYQTGADAYQLFMMWSLLTLGWTIISNFSAQWALWLIISNFFISLWWFQAALPSRAMEDLLYSLLLCFNGLALVLRECGVYQKLSWLTDRWSRVALVIALLFILLIPIESCIIELKYARLSTYISAVIGAIGLAATFFVYRFKLFDMWALSAVVLTGCIITVTVIFKVLTEIVGRAEASTFLFMGLATLGVFTGALVYLRAVANKAECKHD